MMGYRAVDNEVAEAALQKVLKHRWYLTAKLVVFAMFSSNQNNSFETKEGMAKTLLYKQLNRKFSDPASQYMFILFDQQSCLT